MAHDRSVFIPTGCDYYTSWMEQRVPIDG